MLCKYCNADLKPEDKICPVCEKPINSIDEVDNTSNVEQDIVVDIDPSLFAPLEPSEGSNLLEQQDEPLPENEISDLNKELDTNINDSIPMPKEINSENNIPVSTEANTKNKEYKNPMNFVPLIVFIFLIIIFGFAFYISRSPKMIFHNLIDKTYKELSSSMVTDIKNMKGSMSLQTNILTSDEASNEIFGILNNIYLETDYEIDYENKKALVQLNTTYDNEKLINADIYLKDNKGYILLKDVYNKYLSTDVDDFDSLFEQTEITKDHKLVLSQVKKAITKSLSSDYFSKEKVDIKLNDKTVSVTKNSLVLNEDVTTKIKKDVLTYLKDNEKFITSLSNIKKISKDEILTSIEDELESLDLNTTGSSDTKMNVSIYTKGLMNDIARMDLVVNNEGEKLTIEFTKETDNNYSIVLKGTGSTINGSVKLLDNNDENKKVEISFNDPISDTTIGLTISVSVRYNTELTNVDVSNNVDVNTLTEEQTNEIMNKLLENKGIQNLMSVFEETINPYSNVVGQ